MRELKRNRVTEARMAGLEDHPILKEAVSLLKEEDQWALSRALFALESNFPVLNSTNERDVLRALRNILDASEDMSKVKKALKRTSIGQSLW